MNIKNKILTIMIVAMLILLSACTNKDTHLKETELTPDTDSNTTEEPSEDDLIDIASASEPDASSIETTTTGLLVYLENTLIPEKGIYNPLQSEYGSTPDGQDYLRYDYTYDSFLDTRTESSVYIDESEYTEGLNSYNSSGINTADISDYDGDGNPELLVKDNEVLSLYGYQGNEVTLLSELNVDDYKPDGDNITYSSLVSTFDKEGSVYIVISYYGSHSDVSIHAHFVLLSMPDFTPVKSITFEGLSNQEAPQEEWFTDVTTHDYSSGEDNTFTATVAEFSPNDDGMKVDDSYLISQGFLNDGARDIDNLNFLQAYFYEIPEGTSETELLFTELNNQRMTYRSDPRSGAEFTFEADGSFEFVSSYTNGVNLETYISGTKGKFTDVKQIDEYTWQMTLNEWEPLYDEHDETDENGNVTHYSGISTGGDREWFDGGTYYLYLPGNSDYEEKLYGVYVGDRDAGEFYYYQYPGVINHYVLYRDGDNKAYMGSMQYVVDTSGIDMSAYDEDNP